MKILILSYNRFPDGDAGSVRDFIFAKMFTELGHEVSVVAMGENTDYKIMNYKGIEYISLRSKNHRVLSRISNYLGYTFKLKSFIKNHYFGSLPDIIWIVNIPLHSFISIKSFALKNKIKIFHDSVEWYSLSQFKYGFLSYEYITKEFINRLVIDKHFRVIAISKYLFDYYIGKDIASVQIPVLLNKNEIHIQKNVSKNKLVLLYAGSPGKKDYLYTMVKSLIYLSEDVLEKIEFRIIGVSETEVEKMFSKEKDLFDKIKSVLCICGRVSRKKVLENLKQTDFTVLLRNPNLRYSKAGFPTKFVESIASGTPVISNITSDLANYLENRVNGIIVRNCTAESFAQALNEANDLKFREMYIEEMQRKARSTFEVNFHYDIYLKKIGEFLEN